jgi:hypothetical protein
LSGGALHDHPIDQSAKKLETPDFREADPTVTPETSDPSQPTPAHRKKRFWKKRFWKKRFWKGTP